MAARWRKEASEKGLARVIQRTHGVELWENGKQIAGVYPLFKGFSRDISSWYWYGMDRNTSAEKLYFETMEKAMGDCMNYYKEWRKRNAS